MAYALRYAVAHEDVIATEFCDMFVIRSASWPFWRLRGDWANDDVYGRFTIREDGRALPPAYLFQVKTPAESKAPWDYYNLIATTPPDEVWRPLNGGHCPPVHT